MNDKKSGNWTSSSPKKGTSTNVIIRKLIHAKKVSPSPLKDLCFEIIKEYIVTKHKKPYGKAHFNKIARLIPKDVRDKLCQWHQFLETWKEESCSYYVKESKSADGHIKMTLTKKGG